MAQATGKPPAKAAEKAPVAAPRSTWPFESLHREIDRLFEEFDRGFRLSPFGRSPFGISPFRGAGAALEITAPAVDIAENEKEFEITAELPGIDESNIEVNVTDDMLIIKGEKKEETEEKKKNYYLSERHYGSFERSFRLPDGVDADKIDAKFSKGVLKIVVPKSPEAQKRMKKISVKGS